MAVVFKWTGVVSGALLLLAVLAMGVVYGASEYQLRRYAAAPPVEIAVPADATAVEQGRHIATTRGCFGCHGKDRGGKVFFEDRWMGRLVAANLTLKIQHYSDAQVARVLRHGVRPDGTAVIGMQFGDFPLPERQRSRQSDCIPAPRAEVRQRSSGDPFACAGARRNPAPPLADSRP